MRTMAEQDQNLRDMLRELGHALSLAISESPDVHETLQRIRREGYSLQLLLDCKRESSDDADDEQVDADSTANPTFQINAIDLSFLRSIGIDPTRRMRTPRRLRGGRS